MGLAGRKEKQRIPADPRNLSWADNAARFGQAYLSKMGWDPSKGLGASGDGMKSHLKVTHKLDMLGIGAAHQKDPHGIAWKQNKDFENLLRRLNENAGKEEEGKEGKGEVLEDERDGQGEGGSSKVDEEGQVDEDKAARRERKKEKKRKRKEAEDGDEAGRKKSRKKQKGEDEARVTDSSSASQPNAESSEDFVVVQTPVVVVSAPASPKIRARPAAHRARIQASKRLASKSAAAISEILGIAPTPSAAPSPLGTLTPIGDAELTLEKLTTSTKSVADYFKEKLGAKSAGAGTSSVQALNEREETGDYEAPRGGLGLGASRLKASGSDEGSGRPKGGIGSSSAVFAQFFAASTLTTTAVLETVSPITEEESSESKANDEVVEKEGKKRKRKGEDEEGGSEKRDKEVKKTKSKYMGTDESAEGSSSTIPFPTSDEVISAAKKDRKKDKKKKDRETKEDEVDSIPTVSPPIVDDTEALSKDEKKKRKKEKREKAENADAPPQSAIPFPTIDEGKAKKEKAERKARKKARES